MPNLTIYAGANGSGKSTLYHIQRETMGEELGMRFCLDDRISESHKDWRNQKDVKVEAVQAVRDLRQMVEGDQSFNWEMTVISNFAIKMIQKAKDAGFTIKVNFIGAIGVYENIRRVKNRVENGGHGVEDALVEFCVENQFKNIKQLLSIVDQVEFYDNSDFMRLVGRYENGKLEIIDDSIIWLAELEMMLRDKELER